MKLPRFAVLIAPVISALTAGPSLAQCPTPANFCTAAPNSVGPGATISWTGTPSLAADDFHLVANDCPANQFMIFYYGSAQIQAPFGNGWRCVGAGGVGVFRFPVIQIDGSGVADMKVDYTQPPAGGDFNDPGVWLPGTTWNCQGWYRDSAAGGAFFNLTDGLQVQVCAGNTVLFTENFDAVTAPALPPGWTTGAHPSDAGNTAWELGAPSSVGPGAASTSPNCVGTNIADHYGVDTNIWLRTPAIDLTNSAEATLAFNEFKRLEDSGPDLDYGRVRILAANDLEELTVFELAVEGASSGWESYARTLPPEAFGEPIVIEFQLLTDGSNQVGGIENAGFEIPPMADGTWNSTGGPGWTLFGSGGFWNPGASNGYPGSAVPEGLNAGWINNGSLRQTLNAPLTASTQYVLSSEVGNPLAFGSSSGNTFRIELYAGGVLLDVESGTAPPLGQWQPHSLTYDSGPNPPQVGQPLEIRLVADGTAEVNFDAVTITGISGAGIEYAGWYIDDVEVRLEATADWHVLPNSPVAPYYHHDDLEFIGDTGWLCNISGEIWRTTDAGDTWSLVLDSPGTSFRTILFKDAMNGWAGNLGPGSWVGSTSDTNPLYQTTDGGTTWTPVTTITGPTPEGICGMEMSGDTIFAAGRYAGDAYILKSTDAGATWTSTDMSSSFGAFVDVNLISPDEVYITGSSVGGTASLLHSTDGGANWTVVMTSFAYHYWKMGFAVETPTFGYAVTQGGAAGDTWIQTYDGGQSWTQTFYADNFEANGIGFVNDQLGWIGGAETYTYGTSDGGNSWQPFQIDTVYGDRINKFVFVSDDRIYAVGNRVYLYSTQQPLVYSDSGLPPVGAQFDNSLSALDVRPMGDGQFLIQYTVPEDGNAQLTIFIPGGLIYDRPVDEHHEAGTYTIRWAPHDDTPIFNASLVTGMYRQQIKFDNR
ncbi:MAG: photosystem II stability/assembly factor-like uncharacterized protein [Planctomycetota bacterium]|jgi:photosystem II stability/assembly factor-like uncharacterized protein